nr:unnamed protein product [Digitaria exilis]
MTTTSSRTTAETHTSIGYRLRVSFDLVAPPAISLLRYTCTETTPEDKFSDLVVITAHGDTVLLRMACHRRTEYKYDHFVYTSSSGGGSAARRPSLSLLPYPLKVVQRSEGDHNFRPVLSSDTGILRRGGGDGEFAVAQIKVLAEHNGGHGMANLCVLRPGSSQWCPSLTKKETS